MAEKIDETYDMVVVYMPGQKKWLVTGFNEDGGFTFKKILLKDNLIVNSKGFEEGDQIKLI